MIKHLSGILSICLLLAVFSFPAVAQGTAKATLSQLNTKAFPQISSYLRLFDGEGNFVHDLSDEDIMVLEDERAIPVSELNELHQGSQFVVAINVGPSFSIRDVNGVSRYEHIEIALSEWIDTYPSSSRDDLSVVINDGPEGLHFNRPVDWLESLKAYEPNFEIAIPSLNVLTRAINIASDPTIQADMGRGVLFITPLPGQESLAALPSLLSIARDQGVRIYIWLVSSRAYFDSNSAEQLRDFASQTGGKLFPYSGEEPLPNVNSYVDPLRYIYSLTYQSQITSGESHQMMVVVDTNNIETRSQPIEFTLSVQPPNPIFLSPPMEIFRQSAIENSSTDKIEYSPKVQSIEILVEFPDSKPRRIERTTLYVDGEIADENTTPPYDQFEWDLSDYSHETSTLIQVEAVDTLGLSGISLEHEVKIRVQQPSQSVGGILKENAPTIAAFVVALAGGILLFVLIIAGKIQPKSVGRLTSRGRLKPGKDSKVEKLDPVTQPIPSVETSKQQGISRLVNRIPWPKRAEGTREQAKAYLEFRSNTKRDEEGQRIPLSQPELTLGSDASQAMVVLDDNSVGPLHARLRKSKEAQFVISDEGSVAGTWVNFEPIDEQNTRLNHGDIIHIGRVCFCFKLSDIHKIPKPKVIPQE